MAFKAMTFKYNFYVIAYFYYFLIVINYMNKYTHQFQALKSS